MHPFATGGSVMEPAAGTRLGIRYIDAVMAAVAARKARMLSALGLMYPAGHLEAHSDFHIDCKGSLTGYFAEETARAMLERMAAG